MKPTHTREVESVTDPELIDAGKSDCPLRKPDSLGDSPSTADDPLLMIVPKAFGAVAPVTQRTAAAYLCPPTNV